MFEELFTPGTYGYIDYRKRKLLLASLICAAVIVGLIIVGLLIFHNIRNYVMIPAMLMVIPFANFAASFLAVMKFRSAPADRHAELMNFEEQGMLLTDLLVVTDRGKRNFMEFAVIARNAVIGCAATTDANRDALEIEINDKLKGRGLPMRLRVYRDYAEFLQRIEGIEPPQTEEEERFAELAKETIVHCCM